MRRLLLTALFLVLVAPGPAAAAGPIPLNAGWEYRADPANSGLASNWQDDSATDPANWGQVTLPHVFDTRPLDFLFSGSVGWYRLHFTAPEDVPSAQVVFEQIRRGGNVWLNGRALGVVTDGYAPQAFEATGLVPGADNELVVRVDGHRPSTLREGWWNWGGISRRAWLRPVGAVSMEEQALLPKVDCEQGRCGASVTFDGTVVNRTGEQQDAVLQVDLAPPDEGGTPTTGTLEVPQLAPGERRHVTYTLPVAGSPQLWAPDKPRLYAGTVTATIGGEAVGTYAQPVGLRSVKVRGGHLTLNGRGVRLRGASIQEDVQGHGSALTDEDVTRIADQLEAVGADVTRAHYLLDDRLLSELDRRGILVWSQSPVYHRDVLLRTARGRNSALAQVRRTVLAARRHPSVMTHSVANELSPRPDEKPGTRAFLVKAADTVKALDPSVPASLDILPYPGFRFQKSQSVFPLLGVNSYFGWYHGKQRHSTASIFDLEPYLRKMHERYRGQAMVVTEFGAEASRGGPSTEKGTYAFQSDYIRRTLDIVDRTRFVDGAIYWTLGEFAVKPHWQGGIAGNGDSIHNKGLIAYDGEKKPAWQVAHDRFKAVPLYR